MMSSGNREALWYVRFYNNFFESGAIKNIESLPDSKFSRNFGSFVIHLFLKLVAYSIEVNGNLIFELTLEENDDLAYSIAKRFGFLEKLSEVKSALMLLEKYGLIETVQTDKYNQLFIPYVPDNSGSLLHSSKERQLRRSRIKNGELPLKDREAELKARGKLKNVYLSDSEYKILQDNYPGAKQIIAAYGIKMLDVKRSRKESDYENILHFIHSLEGGENNV